MKLLFQQRSSNMLFYRSKARTETTRNRKEVMELQEVLVMCISYGAKQYRLLLELSGATTCSPHTFGGSLTPGNVARCKAARLVGAQSQDSSSRGRHEQDSLGIAGQIKGKFLASGECLQRGQISFSNTSTTSNGVCCC